MDAAHISPIWSPRNRKRLAWWGKVISGLAISAGLLVVSYVFSRFIP